MSLRAVGTEPAAAGPSAAQSSRRAGTTAVPASGGAALALHRPASSRVHDHLLGGKDNYAADRDLARQVLDVLPQAADAARDGRAFLARAVRACAERGVRQFLDLGCGLPAGDNLHQMAARHTAGPRVVYVDADPLVIAHARALLVEGGNIAALQADLRDPASILAAPQVRRLIDPAEPVALVFSSVLHLLPDPHVPLAALGAAAAPGSALVVSHATADHAPAAVAEAARRYAAAGAGPLLPRTAREIERLFGPFAPLPPGLVPAGRWRAGSPPSADGTAILYAGVGVRS
ncbi:SAM-dependent methyltransferase [Actinomadura nitritigenes]|uniref:SAM-dependent methyltransferase n=1 Tax=Actinomadura nitritigenes TaxID=134602 RepID=A0ABS3R4N3_9ACTN|nr:SAM-dependent methyltransferase [Actinomadura nitritigenes]MBO2440633.1 SAM-dependent methyltransferase [Actinomadura nitritigenes]